MSNHISFGHGFLVSFKQTKMAEEDTRSLAHTNLPYQKELMQALVKSYVEVGVKDGTSECEQRFVDATKKMVVWSFAGSVGTLATFGLFDRYWLRFKVRWPGRLVYYALGAMVSLNTGPRVGSIH
jgi:hypothetical protein